MSGQYSRLFVCFPLLCASAALAQSGALRITEPESIKRHTIVTDQPAIQLKGTLKWAGGDKRVLWKNLRGFSDLAAVAESADGKSVEWSTSGPIPLRPGMNQVRIQALGQPGAAEFVNIYFSPREIAPPPPVGTARLFGQEVMYEVIDGRAVYQSDMILGKKEDVIAGRFAGRFAKAGLKLQPLAATIEPNPEYSSGLWPIVSGVVRVPYTITINPGQLASTLTNINAAIAESNSQLAGVVQWVPASQSDVNLVNFSFFVGDEGGTCESIVGMQGGTQPIGGSEACGVGTMLHEMAHAIGIYHEQARVDRNNYITYFESNVDKPQHSNFDISPTLADSGLFNYASIMEYGPFSFSRYGVSPVIETQPAGMVLGTDLPQYTTGDLDGIMRLYGFAPTAVTVDSNPTGLQVTVDGVNCTAPCVFPNWAIGSQHTLSVPLDVNNQTLQLQNQQPYVFGRWNAGASGQDSVTITNSAGNGTLLSPVASPAITNYLASFIPVHPYKPQVVSNTGASGSSVGSITVTPTPGTLIINGVSTPYFPDRDYVTLTVQPSSGYSFYAWNNVALPSFYSRIASIYITSNFDYYNFDTSEPVQAYLVNDVVFTITAESQDVGSTGIYPGFAIGIVEGGNGNATTTAITPQNFDAFNDGPGFKPGASLTLCGSGLSGTACPATAPPQSPVTPNITYQFYQWNGYAGGSANALTITMPNSSASGGVNANFSPSFLVIMLPSPAPGPGYCTGISITSSPSGTNSTSANGDLDAFYTAGTTTFTANAGSSGLTFAGWSQDLGGSESSYPYSLQGETIAIANYNVPGTTMALAVTSISPATPNVTAAAETLTVTGTGFLSGNTQVYFGVGGGSFAPRTTAVQSATQLTVQLKAGDLPAVGYYQILLVNSTAGGCNPQTVFTFAVQQAVAPTLQSIAVTPSNPTVAKGLTEQFTATGTYSDSSTQNLTSSVTWSSGTPGVATISSGGLATVVAASGTTTITATSGSVHGSTVLTAMAAALQSIAVTPSNPTVAKGLTEQFTATATYSDSTTQNLTASVTWSSGTLGVATIASGGLATVVAGSGTTTITATSGLVHGSTVLTATGAMLQSIAVTPANPTVAKGLTEQFTATGTYSDSTTQNLTSSVTWSSGTLGVATIASGGLATVVAGSGTTTITATSGSIQGSTVLTATGAVLQSIAVTPSNPTMAKGLTEQFTATGTYSDNSTQNLTSSVTWSSGTLGVATIASGGLATVVAGSGSTTITATSGSIQGSTVLTATGATLQSIAVTPANPTVAKGLTEQFTATGTYSDSTTQNLTASVTWSSGTLGVATIASGGLATVVAGSGTTTITATSGLVHGSTVLTATGAMLQSIAVTPANPTVAKGLTEQFTATGTYSDSTTQNLTASVTWSSGTLGVATIASGGLATVVAGSGTTTITATLGLVQGSTVLTATGAVLQSIAVTPANPSILVGGAEQFTATGTYSDGSTQNLTASVTWSSSKLAVATINSAGTASGVGVGSSTIGAKLNSVSGSTTLSVGGLGACDVNLDGQYTVADVQAEINEGLGGAQAVNDLNGDHVVNVVDIQIVINAVLNLGCTV